MVTPPIYYPPGIWGGAPLPWPTPPIAPGGGPSHPIVLPPVDPGFPPLTIWGPTDPRPTHPIVLPPTDGQPPKPPEGLPPGAVWPPQYLVVWVPGQGYKIVPIEHPPEHPTALLNATPHA